MISLLNKTTIHPRYNIDNWRNVRIFKAMIFYTRWWYDNWNGTDNSQNDHKFQTMCSHYKTIANHYMPLYNHYMPLYNHYTTIIKPLYCNASHYTPLCAAIYEPKKPKWVPGRTYVTFGSGWGLATEPWHPYHRGGGSGGSLNPKFAIRKSAK